MQLDELTLDGISKAAGQPLDKKLYLESLIKASDEGNLFEVRKQNRLIAYSTLGELENGNWFVLMFVMHPEHRKRWVFHSIFLQLIEYLYANSAKFLVSNVLKNNKASIKFHKKLGFELVRENELGLEFILTLDYVMTNMYIRRLAI